MVCSGIVMLGLFILAFYFNARRQIQDKRWLLKAILFALPLPWIAIETGWFVAEVGRQPWAISEILPTFMATSNHEASSVAMTMIAFILIYIVMFILEMWLMIKFAKQGPSSLHTGRYHFELEEQQASPQLRQDKY